MIDGSRLNLVLSKRRVKVRRRLFAALSTATVLVALGFSLWIATTYRGDPPGDSAVYVKLADNLRLHGIFSSDNEEPFRPTMIRLPGYPIVLAGIFSLFGSGNTFAVFVFQGLMNVAAAIAAAMLAGCWCPGAKRRRKRAAYFAFVLCAFCPFIVSFSSVLLTENLTILLMTVATLFGTLALRTFGQKSYIWWILAASCVSFSVYFRPDSGLFALGLGLALVFSLFFLPADPRRRFFQRTYEIAMKGLVFSFVFFLFLIPWTLRNEYVFGVFQPLAPAHAESAGEYVPHGYYRWLRTWVDDSRFIAPMIWNLKLHPIDVGTIPARAYSSDDERQRVIELITQYNNSDPEHPVSLNRQPNAGENEDSADSDDDMSDDENHDVSSDDSTQSAAGLDLKISPGVDAAFGEIASERIAKEPLRFYVELPLERAATMWFDTHSDYYSFSGTLFPLADLDSDIHQDLWLTAFAILVWAYTLLSFAGCLFLLIDRRGRFWVIVIILMSLPRIAFFSTLENPEPRYLVELFVFAAILGAIAFSKIDLRRLPGKFVIEVRYRP